MKKGKEGKREGFGLPEGCTCKLCSCVKEGKGGCSICKDGIPGILFEISCPIHGLTGSYYFKNKKGE